MSTQMITGSTLKGQQPRNMPSGWTNTTLGEAARIVAGFAFKSKDFGDQGTPVVKITEIRPPYVQLTSAVKVDTRPYDTKRLEKYRLRKGDFLVAMTGATIGKVGRITQDTNAYVNQRVAKFEAISGISDRNFIYYVVSSSGFTRFIDRTSTGSSVQQNISASDIGQMEILLPPLPEQRAIAAVLSSLDDKIELLRSQNETLEKIAQSIFKEWFVDFNFPGKNGKPYKASGGKMVNSELGPIPEGWIVGNLSDLVDHLTNTVSPSESPSGEFWHYSIPAYDDNRTPAREKGRAILSNKFLVPEQVVLVSKLNPKTPRIWLVLDPETNSICSSEFQVIRPKQGRHLPFVYLLLRSEDVTRKLAAKAQGTSSSHQRIRPDDILDIKLPIPDSHILELSNSDVEPILRKMDRNLQQTWSLMALRDALLPKLMSGELRVGKFS